MLPVLLLGAALAATDVSLKASDGVRLHARVEVPKGATKGVVFLHMLGRDGSDYESLAEKLAKGGLATVAPDLRGHGSSDKAGQELTDLDYLAMVLDAKSAVKYLRGRGVTELSCVGASIGANLCLTLAADEPTVGNVVMLSPSLNTKGIQTPGPLKSYGNRPLLIVAAEDDANSMKASTLLHEKALGQVHYELYPQAGHGTRMLNRVGTLEGLIQSWLLGTYLLSSGEVVVPKPGLQVDGSTIKTEGQKLSSHE